MTSLFRSETVHIPMAWHSDSMLVNDGYEVLSEACLEELLQVADELANNPLPVTMLQAEDFTLPNCQQLMQRIRETLDHGIGFAIIDRLPITELNHDTAIKLYWLLLTMVSYPVAQKWDGQMVYDVINTGLKSTAGSGVRSSKTNAGQGYHTDNSFNLPPNYVGLLCLQPAKQGGVSGLISFDSVYNQLLTKHSQVLPRLHQSFFFDRQHEHAPDDDLVSTNPVFEYDGDTLQTRLSTSLIRQGYTVAEQTLAHDSAQALAALDEVMESDSLGKTFDFEQGQIQIINNRRIGHRRTPFVDWPEAERRRHMVRLWLRNSGRPFYLG